MMSRKIAFVLALGVLLVSFECVNISMALSAKAMTEINNISDPQEKVRRYEEELRKAPNDLDTYFWLYLSCYLGQSDKALEVLNRAIALPEFRNFTGKDFWSGRRLNTPSVFYSARGNILFRKKEYEGALDDFTKAISAHADLLSKAATFKGGGNFSPSLAKMMAGNSDVRMIMKESGMEKLSGLYAQRAVAYAAVGNCDEAKADMKKARELLKDKKEYEAELANAVQKDLAFWKSHGMANAKSLHSVMLENVKKDYPDKNASDREFLGKYFSYQQVFSSGFMIGKQSLLDCILGKEQSGDTAKNIQGAAKDSPKAPAIDAKYAVAGEMPKEPFWSLNKENHWTYEGEYDSANSQSKTTSSRKAGGTEEFNGAPAFSYIVQSNMETAENGDFGYKSRSTTTLYYSMGNDGIYSLGSEVETKMEMKDSNMTRVTKSTIDPPFLAIPSNLEVGKNWTTNSTTKYKSKMKLSLKNRGEQPERINETTQAETADHQVLGRETITVPAGTFKCFVIERRIKTSGTMNVETLITEWFAPGVGNIKTRIVTEVNGSSATSEEVLKKYHAQR